MINFLSFSFRIIQSRGLNNDPTPYHSEIIDLLNSNIQQIKKVMQKASRNTNPKNKAA